MADTVSQARRSEIMRNIRGVNTAPEVRVRQYLHALGLRYRKNVRRLPGKPDIVFAGRRVIVFVHGCFWHGCTQCVDGIRAVKSNSEYWQTKVRTNRERDKRHVEALEASGWRVFVIWECETEDSRKLNGLATRIKRVSAVKRAAAAVPATRRRNDQNVSRA